MRKALLALLFVTSIIFFPAGAARADAVVGEPAGAFVATTRDGKSFDLSALRGKVVILNFWATWCPACRDEMPALEAVWRQHSKEGLEMLAVSDDGCGMDQAMLTHIFEPFYSTKQNASGIGLGLAIVHGIMQTHKGKIQVKSEPGMGTTFLITLPLIRT